MGSDQLFAHLEKWRGFGVVFEGRVMGIYPFYFKSIREILPVRIVGGGHKPILQLLLNETKLASSTFLAAAFRLDFPLLETVIRRVGPAPDPPIRIGVWPSHLPTRGVKVPSCLMLSAKPEAILWDYF